MNNPIIISSSSKGNAVIINGVLIDCGVSFKKIKPYLGDLQAVCLTHRHSDHFNASTIKTLAFEKPSLYFVCGEHMTELLLACNVNPQKIVVLKEGEKADFGTFSAKVVNLYHDVPNVAYKLNFGDLKVFYATDTNSLDGIVAKNYDLYLIEGNYSERELVERVKHKRILGEYIYESRVVNTHLSREQAEAWLYENAKENSEYIFMHAHESTG